eukprot:4861098-Pleurochrysis_carterae.AAC.3
MQVLAQTIPQHVLRTCRTCVPQMREKALEQGRLQYPLLANDIRTGAVSTASSKESVNLFQLVAAGDEKALKEQLDQDNKSLDVSILSQPDYAGQTLLHIASLRGLDRIVGMLIDANADVSRVNLAGNTALESALMAKQSACVKLLRGAGVALRLGDAQTAARMHAAVSAGEMETIEMLIAAGASVDAADSDGRQARRRAIYGRCTTELWTLNILWRRAIAARAISVQKK